MVTQLVSAHTCPSNRAKARSTLEHKPVFKSVLDNPFQISWPVVPQNIQNLILARLVAVLENLPPRTHASRKFLENARTSDAIDITEDAAYGCSNHSQTPTTDHALGAPRPVIGINEVTRALECQLRVMRKRIVVDPLTHGSAQLPPCSQPFPIAAVFVCRADVDPSALVDHIQYLVAGCNSPWNGTEPIKLVPLPKGSESTISRLLGVRRAATVAFPHGSPLSETFRGILDSVPIVSAPWLCPTGAQGPPQLEPTHIKQIRTTAPRDMRSARERRLQAREVAKQNSSRSTRRKPRLTLTTG